MCAGARALLIFYSIPLTYYFLDKSMYNDLPVQTIMEYIRVSAYTYAYTHTHTHTYTCTKYINVILAIFLSSVRRSLPCTTNVLGYPFIH